MEDVAAVRMRGIRKRFGSVQALDRAELELHRGEVHAVLGENGAGKTTLLSVLGGLLRPDAGTVEVAGEEVRFATPRQAWARGIGMVHQHFTLVPRLSVLENLILGSRSRLGGLALPREEVSRRARVLMDRTGWELDLSAPVETLGVGRQQRVELLRVLLKDPRVLVLDEPTAVLAPREVEGLLRRLRELAADGRAVVLVAHKLDEVLAVADRLTVLRDGRTVLEAPRPEVDSAILARAMVGREVSTVERAGDGHGEPGEVVARLRGVTVEGSSERPLLDGVELEVRRGEIVGVAGVEGNGQRELARVLARRLVPDAGTVEAPPDPAFVPQDRQHEGLVPGFDLAENVALALHRRSVWRRGPFLRWGALRKRTRELADRFGVVAPGTRARVSALSGGNQQRVVLARELADTPALVVAENPTRGLDVAGEAFVHRELLGLRDGEAPPGVVLVSTDLDEILRLADRVVVMVRGRILAVPPEERTREGVGARMLTAGPGDGAGGRPDERAPWGGAEAPPRPRDGRP